MVAYFDKRYVRKSKSTDAFGYDKDNNVQVVPVGVTTRISLVGDAEPVIDDEAFAHVTLDPKENRRLMTGPWAMSTGLRDVFIKGVAPGKTKLRAKKDGQDVAIPLDIVVVNNKDYRRVSDDEVSVDMRVAIQSSSLREAVLMVADDQHHSKIGISYQYGRYGFAGNNYEWCGLFSYWCWRRACAIKGVPNPLGDNGERHFLSVIKSISWAMNPDSDGNLQLLRYAGGDPYNEPPNKRVQEYHELGYNGWNLQPGDIMCWRDAKRFRHMDLVYSFSGSTLTTIDGNYSLSEPITKRTWDMNAKINAKDYAHVYMHVDV